jgi:hypothetical protein
MFSSTNYNKIASRVLLKIFPVFLNGNLRLFFSLSSMKSRMGSLNFENILAIILQHLNDLQWPRLF